MKIHLLWFAWNRYLVASCKYPGCPPRKESESGLSCQFLICRAGCIASPHFSHSHIPVSFLFLTAASMELMNIHDHPCCLYLHILLLSPFSVEGSRVTHNIWDAHEACIYTVTFAFLAFTGFPNKSYYWFYFPCFLSLGQMFSQVTSDNCEICFWVITLWTKESLSAQRMSLCTESQDWVVSPCLFCPVRCFMFTYSEFHLYLSVALYQEVLQQPVP